MGTRVEIASALIKTGLACVGAYISARIMLRMLDPNTRVREECKKRSKELLRQLGVSGNIDLNEHELQIAGMIHFSDDESQFQNVAGYKNLLKEIRQKVIIPMKLIHCKERLPATHRISVPRGILLTGPPGCGKTQLARSIASSVSARMLVVDYSVLTDKWFGESQKYVAALFSLAKKLEPCIIFLDEIDSFLRTRNAADNETSAIIKAQFMTLWDGFNTDPNSEVIIIGATNNRDLIDPAILRRLPLQFIVPLPDTPSRIAIIKHHLAGRIPDDGSSDVNFVKLGCLAYKLSGADLKAVCQSAISIRFNKCYEAFIEENGGEDNFDAERFAQTDLYVTDKDMTEAVLGYFNCRESLQGDEFPMDTDSEATRRADNSTDEFPPLGELRRYKRNYETEFPRSPYQEALALD